MSISIEDLRSISYSFEFFEREFSSSSKREQERWNSICSAKFALSEYSGKAKSSGKWILVRVNEDKITVVYKNGGSAGNSTDITELPTDTTKERIKKAIDKYM